ncbi:hypothetical protein [Geodermatophilus sp. URMC 64]
MADFPTGARVPDAMPLLSRGKHRNPARGACFMEFTSLLAGGPFTDDPGCVDRELAAVLRGANDKLCDADRPLLVPLLGRAIGLAVAPPPKDRTARRSAPARRRRREEQARFREESARLRRAVARRFAAALGSSFSPATEVWCGGGEELSWLFWDLMNEPTPVSTSKDYVRRLVARLHLLHECYEQAMDDLGLPRAVPAVPVPAEEATPVTT